MRLRSWPLLVVPFLFACGAAEEPVGSAEEPIKVCPGSSTLDGIDISHYDGAIDWAKVKASGQAFAFIKATEGTAYVDPTFATNWAGMKQHGVVRSAYHFFHANLDPIAEADHFLKTLGPLETGDLPPTLDLEVSDGETGATITATAIQWLDYVAQKTGMKPILYTSPSFVTGTMGSPPGLEKHALLWIANWGAVCPTVPAPFTSWGFWQTSDQGVVPGVADVVDVNVFNGTAADLTGLTVNPPSSSSSSSSGAGAGASSSGAGGAGGGGGGGGGGSAQDSPGCSCSTAGGDDRAPGAGAGCLLALAFVLHGRARGRGRRALVRGDGTG